MELDERAGCGDYSMTAYLIVRNGSIEGVTYLILPRTTPCLV